MRRLVRVLLVLLVATVALAGCGKDEKDAAAGKAACPAAPAALTGPSGLPSGFPVPNGVVLAETKAAGPSTIVTGFAEKSLTDVFNGYKQALSSAPYSVTKSEHDAHDAEVAFAGSGTTGQVKLGEACAGRTSITITARPA
jgi:hypothetical protein